MINSCIYEGMTPVDNTICNKCSLFLYTCMPIASEDGYALAAECDLYFCDGCPRDCVSKGYVNLT